MVKYLSSVLCLIVFASCTLSGDQEKKLNESVSIYLNARNSCLPIPYVAYTYPDLVKNLKTRGDKAFRDRFDCAEDTIDLQDPTIKTIESDGKIIHVMYNLDAYNKYTAEFLKDKHQLIAISNDDGASWFFLDKTDYADKLLLPNLKRLIKE